MNHYPFKTCCTFSLVMLSSQALTNPLEISSVPPAALGAPPSNIIFYIDDTNSVSITVGSDGGATRLDATKETIQQFLKTISDGDTQTDTRIGLAKFKDNSIADTNNTLGVDLLRQLTLINNVYNWASNSFSAHCAGALSSTDICGIYGDLTSINNDGGAGNPISEMFAGLGYYFADDATSVDVGGTLYPAPTFWESGLANGNFYDSGGASWSDSLAPEPLNLAETGRDDEWCGQNHIIAFTDLTNNNNDDLTNPMTLVDSSSNIRLDIGTALYEYDLAPNVNDPLNNSYLNNIQPYFIRLQSGSVSQMRDTLDPSGNQLYEFDATQPAADSISDLADNLYDIANRPARRTLSTSAVEFNTPLLDATTRLYKTEFTSDWWSGDLMAYDVDDQTGAIAASPLWRASQQIPAHSSRAIYTWTESGTPRGIPFTTSSYSSFDSELQNDIALWSSADTTQRNRFIDYLRGEQTYEINGSASSDSDRRFRTRRSLIGDIVHSSPTHVGSEGMEAGANINGRTEMIYVGSNNGMLHGFRADTGAEVFSYIPKGTHSTTAGRGLHALVSPDYGLHTPHHHYVDGTAIAGDLYDGANWKTYLVGTLGRGGKGIFGIDITDPVASFSASNIKWDLHSGSTLIGDSNYQNDIGHIHGEPRIAKLNNGDYGVIFGNGINSQSEKAALYLLDVADGGLIKKFTISPPNSDNGMSGATLVDLDKNGTVDWAYAGDLQGHLHAFDLTDADPANWTHVTLFDGSTNSKKRPITAAPSVALRDNGHIMLMFGSGMLFQEEDRSLTPTTPAKAIQDSQYFAAIEHDLSLPSSPITLGDLKVRELTGSPFRSLTASTSDAITSEPGWYLLLESSNTQNERVLHKAQQLGNAVIFHTVTFDTSTKRYCGADGGGWLMGLELSSGLPLPLFDADEDGDYADNNTVVGVPFEPNRGIPAAPTLLGSVVNTPGSLGTVEQVTLLGTTSTGQETKVIGWKEE